MEVRHILMLWVICCRNFIEMTEIIQIVQFFMTFLVVPVFVYIVKLERRITRLETKIEFICFNIEKRGGEKT